MSRPEINREVAKKVLQTVDAGLVKGLGTPKPGQMCVEAAVCYALGLPHSDNPRCVGQAVRTFKIVLNDADWSSNQARAAGMRRVAVAQLGSDSINQTEFAKELAFQTVRQILPITLRRVAELIPSHWEVLETAAFSCEKVDKFEQCEVAARFAAQYAQSAQYAEYARFAAQYAQYAESAARYAAQSARYAALSAEYAEYAHDKKDSILNIAAEIGVQALIKLGAKGVEWLDLCD